MSYTVCLIVYDMLSDFLVFQNVRQHVIPAQAHNQHVHVIFMWWSALPCARRFWTPGRPIAGTVGGHLATFLAIWLLVWTSERGHQVAPFSFSLRDVSRATALENMVILATPCRCKHMCVASFLRPLGYDILSDILMAKNVRQNVIQHQTDVV